MINTLFCDLLALLRTERRAALVFIFSSMLSLSLGCDEGISTTKAPELIVTPASLEISAPPSGMDYVEATLDLRNAGDSPLTIVQVDLIESDNIQELSILDANDWEGRVVIESGVNKVMRIGWRVLDAQADTATLKIFSNGGDGEVEISTADLDPEMIVTTEPTGQPSQSGVEIELNEAMGGGWQRAHVLIQSFSGAPLTIDNICLLNGDGACIAQDELPEYLLCEGSNATPEQCSPISRVDPLPFEQTYSFSILFMPPPQVVDTYIGRVRVQSDASSTPDYLIKLKGRPCLRLTEDSVCGACGDGVVNEERGEVCDDQNLDESDDCLNHCQASCLALGTCPAEDMDMDGVIDSEDNCPMASNPNQADCDEDGRGDVCDEDACPAMDRDEDGVVDVEDNCVEVFNPDQADCNQDGRGDVCDESVCGPDGDGDGVIDVEDNCVDLSNPAQLDRDEDGAGDLCDVDPDNANYILLQQGFVQAGGLKSGDRFQLRGTLSSGAHSSTGDVFTLRGRLMP